MFYQSLWPRIRYPKSLITLKQGKFEIFCYLCLITPLSGFLYSMGQLGHPDKLDVPPPPDPLIKKKSPSVVRRQEQRKNEESNNDKENDIVKEK